MSNTRSEITIDEIVALLSRSSLPTIIVEGNEDMIVYRTFEQNLSHIGVDVLAVGGRPKVLEIFKRKNEIQNHDKILFIADLDTWVNTGIPSEFVDVNLIFTDGYSIENDIYIDGELWKLLSASEAIKFNQELALFVDWYALALNRHLQDPEKSISLHPEYVLNPTIRPGLLELMPNEIYPTSLKDVIYRDHSRLVRGKSLINLLVRNVSYPGRSPKHSAKSLLETVAIRPGTLLKKMSLNIQTFFE